MKQAMVRVAGHFGELLQGRLGATGPVVLVTLPCPKLGVTATLAAGQGFSLTKPSAPIMTMDRARAFLSALNLPLTGRIGFTAEMPPGGGAGVSTAALVALARLAGWSGEDMALARACVAIEGASDPLIFAHPSQLLWASRQGEIISMLPPPPALEVIGGFYGSPRRTDPHDDDFPDIADLIPQWIMATMARDLPRIAALTSTSAERTLSRRGAQSDPTASLAIALGALGHVIAHTGSARGLIFAPGTVPVGARAALEAAGLNHVVQFRPGGGR